jgi:dipeptidyl-peptidase-3
VTATRYFSSNCTEADAELAGRFLDSVGLSPYNTRLFKDEKGVYTVRIASAKAQSDGGDPVGALCREHVFEGHTFLVTRGDYSALMARVVAALKDAIPHAANDAQRAMLER